MTDDANAMMVRRNPGLIEAEVDDEMVALHVDNGTCYGFNPTAFRIWQLIEHPRSVADICDALVAEFDVAPGSCEAEVRTLLDDLAKDDLVSLARG